MNEGISGFGDPLISFSVCPAIADCCSGSDRLRICDGYHPNCGYLIDSATGRWWNAIGYCSTVSCCSSSESDCRRGSG